MGPHWRRPTYPTGARLKIRDGKALATIVRRALTTRFGGDFNRAARDLGVGRSTLQRLASAPSASMHQETLDRLMPLFSEEDRVSIRELLYPEGSDKALSDNAVWLKERLVRFDENDPVVRAIKRRIERDAKGVMEELAATFAKGEFHPDRRRLALLRLIEPFLDHFESGGMERGADEMPPDELKRLVELRWESERLLLRRTPDARRAQDIYDEDVKPPRALRRRKPRP